MKFKRHSVIGMDFAGKSLGLVQLTKKANAFELVDAARAPKRECGEGITPIDAARVMGMLDNRRFRGVRVVVPVPLDMQLLGSFEIPPPESGAPIDEITRSELARDAKVAQTDIESDWWALPSTGRNTDATRAITVGVVREHANALAMTLEDRGFEPTALDVRGLAILRACRGFLEGREKISTFVEIGESSTLTCVCLNDTIVFYRRVEEGLDSIVADVMRAFAVDPEVAEHLLKSCLEKRIDAPPQVRDLQHLVSARLNGIVQTVRAAISYASHRYPRAEIGNVLALGPGADALDVVPVFDDLIGQPVRRVTLGDVCGATNHPLRAQSGLVVAAGLAMYGDAA